MWAIRFHTFPPSPLKQLKRAAPWYTMRYVPVSPTHRASADWPAVGKRPADSTVSAPWRPSIRDQRLSLPVDRLALGAVWENNRGLFIPAAPAFCAPPR